jgi:signal transduction histidine kinase/CheY-like chemotaxis protein
VSFAEDAADKARTTAGLCLGLLSLAACAALAQPVERAARGNILILHSYDSTYNWSVEVTQGLRVALEQHPLDLGLWTEYLDSRRLPKAQAWDWMDRTLELRHSGRRFDVIVACDDAAAEYLVEHSPAALRNTPVVFCGVGSQALIDRMPRTRFTGVKEISAAPDFLDEVLKFLPGVRQVVVMTDNSEAGEENRRFYAEIEAARPHLRFRLLDGSRLSVEEMLGELGALERDTLLVWTRFTRDREGRFVSPRWVAAEVAQASTAPVVSPNVSLLGQGFLAGNTSAGFAHGELAGKLVVEVLHGVPPHEIPLREHGNIRLVIDDGVAARFGVPRSSLPRDAEIVGAVGGWRALSGADRNLLLAGAVLVVLQMLTILVLVVNIWMRRKAERELKTSREMLERAQRIAHIGLWSRDPATGKLVWSDETARLFGVAPGSVEPTYETFLGFVHPADRERVDGIVRASDSRRQSRVLEFRLQAPGRPERYIRSVGEWTTGPNGEPLVAGMVQDITEQKQMEEMLRQMQRMESVGTLAGGVAHDFNNLLTVINGYGQLLAGALSEQDARRLYVREIQRAGERASELTRQLLAFSRKQILSPRLLDLNELVRESEGLLKALLGDRVELELRLSDALCLVHADPLQIEQVLINLAANARDAMPQGGRLEIGTSTLLMREYSGVAEEAITPGRYVELRIADTGCGMDDATRRRVFEPFFTTKPVGRGTGLGLASVYGVVRQSGGLITVESEVGQGTTFRVLLPSAQGALPPQQESPAEEPRMESGRVLVVDPDPQLSEMIGLALRQAGYEVEFDQRPDRLHKMLRAGEGSARPPDLVLTEMHVHAPSGFRLVRELRAQFPALRVLFLSSGETGPDAARLERGEAVLEKPFTPAALKDAVRRLLMQPA